MVMAMHPGWLEIPRVQLYLRPLLEVLTPSFRSELEVQGLRVDQMNFRNPKSKQKNKKFLNFKKSRITKKRDETIF